MQAFYGTGGAERIRTAVCDLRSPYTYESRSDAELQRLTQPLNLPLDGVLASSALPAVVAAEPGVRVAYADPPYEGQAKKHYGDQPTYAGEVDHPALIAQLVEDFPDGWALSCKSNSLRGLLPLCPADVRVGVWTKTFAVIKANVRVTYAWEPVIWRGGRRSGNPGEIFDWVKSHIVMRNDENVRGSKPEPFCLWIFALLGLEPVDELVDLFPGSGAVTRVWEKYRGQTRLPLHGYPRGGSDKEGKRSQMEMGDAT